MNSCKHCELESKLEIALKYLENYKEDREELLSSNWELAKENHELKKKIEQADKQIKEDLKDLAFCKNYLIEFKKEYDILANRCKTLLACMPERETNETSNR